MIVSKHKKISGKKKPSYKKNYINKNRVGDHIWYITNNLKFKNDYPKWKQKYNIKKIIDELIESIF